MTVNLALEYIPRRMQELGFGNKYHLRFRHFILQDRETVNLKAFNSFFILIEEPARINIKSQNGIFNIALTNANEMTYEHHGQIQIRNTSTTVARARFIQVIPYK